MINDKDFEAMLQESLPEIPPENIVNDVTPWKQGMDRVVAGIAMSTITFQFLCLDYILPAIGLILLLLGFRALRKENQWFRLCYIFTVIKALCLFPILIINATIYQSSMKSNSLLNILTILNLIIVLVMLYCLWQAIKAVQRKAGLEPNAESAGTLIVWYLLVCVCGLIKINSIIIVGGLIVVYFFILRSLSQLSKELDQTGYLIQASEVRFCDTIIINGITGLLLIGILCGYLFFDSYPMEWREKETVSSAETTKMKEHLIKLGFPEDVLNDMTDEEILCYKDASRIVVDVNEYPFNDGREVEESYLEERWITTVYDVKELKVTDIAVELNNDKTWVFLHHFFWQEEPEYFGFSGFYGTESIQIWPVYYDHIEGWRKCGEATGRLLYDKDDVTYICDYQYLGEKTYTSNDVFFGTQTSNDLFAAFSLPKGGDMKRGYVMYQAEELEEGWVASSWFNYTHQMHFLQYPVKTAMESRISSGWNDAGAFKTIQDSLQFYVTDDGIELAGE